MRLSDSIDRRQADNLRDAFKYARTEAVAMHSPLNLYAVLNFDHAEPWDVSPAFEVLRRNHLSRWLRHHTRGRVPACFIWCIENVATPYGGGSNLHANLVVDIPRRLQTQFEAKLPLWLARVTKAVAVPENAVHVQPVNDDRGGLGGLQNYFLKGVNPHDALHYGIRPIPQGRVVGKRCGVSESLGPAARQRSSWPAVDLRTAA